MLGDFKTQVIENQEASSQNCWDPQLQRLSCRVGRQAGLQPGVKGSNTTRKCAWRMILKRSPPRQSVLSTDILGVTEQSRATLLIPFKSWHKTG